MLRVSQVPVDALRELCALSHGLVLFGHPGWHDAGAGFGTPSREVEDGMPAFRDELEALGTSVQRLVELLRMLFANQLPGDAYLESMEALSLRHGVSDAKVRALMHPEGLREALAALVQGLESIRTTIEALLATDTRVAERTYQGMQHLVAREVMRSDVLTLRNWLRVEDTRVAEVMVPSLQRCFSAIPAHAEAAQDRQPLSAQVLTVLECIDALALMDQLVTRSHLHKRAGLMAVVAWTRFEELLDLCDEGLHPLRLGTLDSLLLLHDANVARAPFRSLGLGMRASLLRVQAPISSLLQEALTRWRDRQTAKERRHCVREASAMLHDLLETWAALVDAHVRRLRADTESIRSAEMDAAAVTRITPFRTEDFDRRRMRDTQLLRHVLDGLIVWLEETAREVQAAPFLSLDRLASVVQQACCLDGLWDLAMLHHPQHHRALHTAVASLAYGESAALASIRQLMEVAVRWRADLDPKETATKSLSPKEKHALYETLAALVQASLPCSLPRDATAFAS